MRFPGLSSFINKAWRSGQKNAIFMAWSLPVAGRDLRQGTLLVYAARDKLG